MSAEVPQDQLFVEVPPSSCMASVDRLGWSSTVPLQAGGRVLGVRVNTVGLAVLLRDVFADRLALVPDAPSNLSLLLAPRAPAGEPQDLHRLYVTCSRQVRTRSALRATLALWQDLDVRDVGAARERLQVTATVLLREGEAVVLPDRARPAIVDDDRRWLSRGFVLVDRRQVEFDPAGGTVSVPDPQLPYSAEVLRRRFRELGIEDQQEPPAPAGTFPISAWVLWPGERTLAMRVIAAAAQVVDRSAHDGVALIEGLAGLLDRTPDVVLRTPEDLWEQLGVG